MALTTYTSALTREQVDTLREVLLRQGFTLGDRDYAYFCGKKGKLSVTAYEKGPKVLVQGKEAQEFVEFILEPEVLGSAQLGYEEQLNPEMFKPHFGIDESGKGDVFGPLVVAGAFTNAASARALLDAGVMDSKRVTSAQKISRLATVIKDTPGVAWKVLMVSPARYNELYASFKNLNRLLAWGHAKVIEELAKQVPDCPRALSDQFARKDVLERALRKQGVEITLQQRTKGESDVAVAAASILARDRFLTWMEKASGNLGLVLPLGASRQVRTCVRSIVSEDSALLPEVAKMHFKTVQQLLP